MANPDREAVIELGGRIAGLRAELLRVQHALRAAEAELDAFLDGGSVRAATSDAAQKALASVREVSMNQRIIAAIDAEPMRMFEAEDLFKILPEANQTSIRSALSRLAEQERIVRTSRGQYQSAKREVDAA